jgi:LysM repeat protein
MSTVTISAGSFGAGTFGAGSRAARGDRRRRVTPARAVTPARRTAPVRLTRRGRLATTLVLLVAFLTGGVLLAGGLATAGTEPGAAATAERVTVRPGETLWSIAQREVPGTDPRDTVEDILRLNHLDSVAVEAGSVLLLP